jgi:hypothetical protein
MGVGFECHDVFQTAILSKKPPFLVLGCCYLFGARDDFDFQASKKTLWSEWHLAAVEGKVNADVLL